MKMKLLVILVMVVLAVAVIAAPAARTSRITNGAAIPSRSASSPSSSTPSVDTSGRGQNDDQSQDKSLKLSDIAGGFAFKAHGIVAFGGPGSAVPSIPVGTPPVPVTTASQQLFVAVEGRICFDKNGRCAINAWVNTNGFESFHIDTRLGNGAPACQVDVDEFGQGSIIIPIDFTTDGGASPPPPIFAGAFPTLITVRFQVANKDKAFLEIEGCGATGRPVPGTTNNSPFQNTCSDALPAQGRVPLALTGVAERIGFRCSNCHTDDFVFATDGLDEDYCPFDSSQSHSGRGIGNSGPSHSGL